MNRINKSLVLIKSEKIQKVEERHLEEIKYLVVQGQNITNTLLYKGFCGLSIQNQELLELTKKLSQQLNEVTDELEVLKKEREKRVIQKKARANRKRLPKRQPITAKIYELLMQAAGSPGYVSVRLRIAFCLLTITGIRINELLPLKVGQLQTLLESYWISIDRSKRGPVNHKAFLTREGRKLVNERKKDFEFISLMKNQDSYIFTSELNHNQMLSRETITRDVNKVMHSVSKSLPDQPQITSHSFRIGYISKLWKDSQDIEFVKQSIGHRKLDTTSSYIEKLSDEERQERTFQLR